MQEQHSSSEGSRGLASLRKKRIWRLGTLLAAAGFGWACSSPAVPNQEVEGTEPSPQQTSTLASIPVPPSSGGLQAAAEIEVDRLPAQSLFIGSLLAPDQGQISAYDNAVGAYRSRCMAEAGFVEVPQMVSLYPTAQAQTVAIEFLYFEDESMVREFGYYWPNRSFGMAQAPSGVPETTIPAEMSEALERCNEPIRSLQLQAYEDAGLVGVVPEIFDSDVFDAVNARVEVQEVYADWKLCMSAAGFPEARLREPGTTVETTQQAIADFGCRKSTGYTAVIVAAQAEEVELWVEDNLDTVTAFRELWSQMVAGASALQESSG